MKNNDESKKVALESIADPSRYPHLDLSTTYELGYFKEYAEKSVTVLANSFAIRTPSFMNTVGDPYKFPYDIEGVKILEEFLTTVVKPQIAEWTRPATGTPRIKKIFTSSGLKSGNAERVDFLNKSATTNVGFVLGQCIGQAYGGKWQEEGNKELVLQVGDLTVNPFWKPLKFLKNGAEDSLVSFFKVCDPARAARDRQFQQAIDRWLADRNLVPDDIVCWHGEKGVEQIDVKIGKKVHVFACDDKLLMDLLTPAQGVH